MAGRGNQALTWAARTAVLTTTLAPETSPAILSCQNARNCLAALSRGAVILLDPAQNSHPEHLKACEDVPKQNTCIMPGSNAFAVLLTGQYYNCSSKFHGGGQASG